MNSLGYVDQESWIRRLQANGLDRSQAIEELRAYLVRGLNRSLKHRYGGKIQVEDVAQVALIKILDSLDSFRCQSRFGTWAMSIAIRIGISELRKRYYRDVSLDLSLKNDNFRLDIVDPSVPSVADEASRQSLIELLNKLISETLTEKQQIAIQGTLVGLPIEEIAARLQSNRGAVYKLVHDARVRLRRGFEANGITADDISSTIV